MKEEKEKQELDKRAFPIIIVFFVISIFGTILLIIEGFRQTGSERIGVFFFVAIALFLMTMVAIPLIKYLSKNKVKSSKQIKELNNGVLAAVVFTIMALFSFGLWGLFALPRSESFNLNSILNLIDTSTIGGIVSLFLLIILYRVFFRKSN